MATRPEPRYCYDGNIFDPATGLCQTASPAIPYALGRLTSNGVASLTATSFTDFDSMGRVKASTLEAETSPGVYTSYNFPYSYNLELEQPWSGEPACQPGRAYSRGFATLIAA